MGTKNRQSEKTLSILDSNPYSNQNDKFTVYQFKDKEEWKQARIKGVGGSDISAIVGMNPYKTNVDLYKEKIATRYQDVNNSNEYIEYGIFAEPIIRKMWEYEHRDTYTMFYQDNTILMNNEHTEMLYSPDGLLYDRKNNKYGIWECKTSYAPKHWKRDTIPENYYCQILHGLNVTGFDFVILRARIVYSIFDTVNLQLEPSDRETSYIVERDYYFDKSDRDTLNDMFYLQDEIIKFWNNNVLAKVPPKPKIEI